MEGNSFITLLLQGLSQIELQTFLTLHSGALLYTLTVYNSCLQLGMHEEDAIQITSNYIRMR